MFRILANITSDNVVITSLQVQGYWTYELCHGQSLRQYHEENTGKVNIIFYLYNYSITIPRTA